MPRLLPSIELLLLLPLLPLLLLLLLLLLHLHLLLHQLLHLLLLLLLLLLVQSSPVNTLPNTKKDKYTAVTEAHKECT
jgi:hypothetical protein